MVTDIKKIFKLFTFLIIGAVIILLASTSWEGIEKAVYPKMYSEFVERYSTEYSIDETLVYAIIKTESSFDPEAVSDAGAIGLMQIMPDTFRWLQTKTPEKEKLSSEALYDPETNIKYGAFFLSLLLKEFEDTRLVAAAYHAGRGQVNEWLDDKAVSPDGRTLPDIPSRSTAHYVSKVIKNIGIYEKIYDER